MENKDTYYQGYLNALGDILGKEIDEKKLKEIEYESLRESRRKKQERTAKIENKKIHKRIKKFVALGVAATIELSAVTYTGVDIARNVKENHKMESQNYTKSYNEIKTML